MKKLHFVLAITLCVLLGSCTTTKYVQVPEYHTDTICITQQQYDSIYVHDSIYKKERGDTLLIERWHTRYKEKLVHDTTYISKVDTIAKPYPVEVKVAKPLTWFQQVRIHIGNVILIALGFALIYCIVRLCLKFFKPL